MNNVLARIGACTLVSAFGTAILLPAIRFWVQANIIWWLLFVLIAGIAIGAGTPALKALPRVFIALIPPICIAIYIAFFLLVLKRSLAVSGVSSEDPQFWVITGFLMAISWPFAFALSYCKSLVAAVVKFFVGPGNDGKVDQASKTTTAVIGLFGAVGLLLRAVGVFEP